jgi:hypothetical protein
VSIQRLARTAAHARRPLAGHQLCNLRLQWLGSGGLSSSVSGAIYTLVTLDVVRSRGFPGAPIRVEVQQLSGVVGATALPHRCCRHRGGRRLGAVTWTPPYSGPVTGCVVQVGHMPGQTAYQFPVMQPSIAGTGVIAMSGTPSSEVSIAVP